MSREVTTIKGKKYSIPKCFSGLIFDLESLVGVEAVGMGKFSEKKRHEGDWVIIKHFDESKRTIKVVANIGRWQEDFFIRIDPAYRDDIEEYIKNYQF